MNAEKFRSRLLPVVGSNGELISIDWLDADNHIVSSTSTNHAADPIGADKQTFLNARQDRAGLYAPLHAGKAGESPHISYFLPLFASDRYIGAIVAAYSPSGILNELVPWWVAHDYEITLLDADDGEVARRSSGGPGRNVYTHRRELDLPGTGLVLRTNSVKGSPRLLPGLLVGSVIALSLGLLWSLGALWRDINRRLATEGALRQQVAFQTAMENSLVTGLRARDMTGRVTYVNPAFCRMVGLPASELIGRRPPMPYWAPEAMGEYQQRISELLAGTATAEEFRTIFQRSNGERFPVLIFEAPLVDGTGRQTGWMGSILDISDRQRAEDINRQQQEKLQTSARLAAMGEIASTLAHELNQPLAAVSSYLTGALNIIEGNPAIAGSPLMEDLKPAIEKAAAQTQRAGHTIRSVHSFIKRRETSKIEVDLKELIDRVMPLIELQAQRKFVTVQKTISELLPAVVADPTLLEQVLLNLTRNAIDAMEDTPSEKRILRIEAYSNDNSINPGLTVAVIDHGGGISKEIEEKLFSPFFSTKADGMGMGLNICRTAVEAHGGTLSFMPNPEGGTIFRFSLPAE
jgi:two-component system sensor histidine kinase DctS